MIDSEIIDSAIPPSADGSLPINVISIFFERKHGSPRLVSGSLSSRVYERDLSGTQQCKENAQDVVEIANDSSSRLTLCF